MDAVDQQQQREIDSLRDLVKRLIIVLLTLLTMAGITIFCLIVDARNCPHRDCPHHHVEVARD